jgi:hypothetical protein
MKIYISSILPVIFFLSGCEGIIDSPLFTSDQPPPDQLTWVAHYYSGGVQCDPSVIYNPPAVETVLYVKGIIVFETEVELYGSFACCGCPTYAAMHYALIRKTDLARAEQLGFEQKDPPQP